MTLQTVVKWIAILAAIVWLWLSVFVWRSYFSVFAEVGIAVALYVFGAIWRVVRS